MRIRPSMPRLLFALAGLAGCTAAPAPLPSDAARPASSPQAAAPIHAVLAAFDVAWNRHEIRELKALLADDVQWIVSNGNCWRSRQQVCDAYSTLHQHLAPESPMSTVRTEHVEVQILDTKIAQGMATLVFGDGSNGVDQDCPGWRMRASFVMVRNGGAWQIAQFHQTLLDPSVQRADPLWGDAAGRTQSSEGVAPVRR